MFPCCPLFLRKRQLVCCPEGGRGEGWGRAGCRERLPAPPCRGPFREMGREGAGRGMGAEGPGFHFPCCRGQTLSGSESALLWVQRPAGFCSGTKAQGPLSSQSPSPGLPLPRRGSFVPRLHRLSFLHVSNTVPMHPLILEKQGCLPTPSHQPAPGDGHP